jgi:hypothetical protein
VSVCVGIKGNICSLVEAFSISNTWDVNDLCELECGNVAEVLSEDNEVDLREGEVEVVESNSSDSGEGEHSGKTKLEFSLFEFCGEEKILI